MCVCVCVCVFVLCARLRAPFGSELVRINLRVRNPLTVPCARRQLVSGCADGTVKVWTVRGAECAATLDAHGEKVCTGPRAARGGG